MNEEGDGIEFVNTLFLKGLNRFKEVKEKEEVLKVHVRYLKFLIASAFEERVIQKAFKV